MSNQAELIAIIKAMSGQSNILTVPRAYVKFTKSHRAALFLSQCVYWNARSKYPDGWFYKSFREWEDELGLNQHAVETCVKALKAGGWMETRLDRVGTRDITFYKPNLEKIAESLSSTLAETAKVTLAETAKVTLAETAKVPKRKTLRSSITHRLLTKPPDSVSTTRDIQGRYIQLLGYDPGDWAAGESKAAKAISERWTTDQLETAYNHFKAQPFWSDKRLTLVYLKKQMPELFKNGNGNSKRRSEPDEQMRQDFEEWQRTHANST